jgi:hypothetical protein
MFMMYVYTIRLYGQSIQIVPINGFGSGLIEEVPGFCAERGMTPGVAVSASNFCFFGRGFQPRSSRLESRSHRGNANSRSSLFA